MGSIFALHVHTNEGSMDSALAPEEFIEEAHRLGINGAVLAEHDGWQGNRFLDYNNKVYKLSGKEASISPLFNKSSSGQGITWNVNALEAAACLGMFMDADIEYQKLGDPNRPT